MASTKPAIGGQLSGSGGPGGQSPRLVRTLTLWNLIFIGLVIVQPTAPMGIFGVISNKAHGHVVSAVLIAMVAMLLTAISYGRMARAYPSAGSAYTYVGKEIHPALGYITGWSMVMDYILNPLICTAFCAQATMNIVSGLPYYAWILIFAGFFTWANLRGIKASARMNEILCVGMMIVVLIFLAATAQTILHIHHGPGFFTHPFYNPQTFTMTGLFAGTSVATLTYIGFDGVSTLSEEAENPRRNILIATVLLCLIAGTFSAIEVYAAQLLWGSGPFPESNVEAAFATAASRAGGAVMFQLINVTLIVANMGSAMGAQLTAGRLLYGMGRGGALPKSFFGKIDPRRNIPRNGILAVGAFALIGAGVLQFFSKQLGGGAFAIGAQCLNFGALLAFMGVNASSFVRYWLHAEKRTLSNLLPPVVGFLVCGFIWLHLSRPALILGGVWMTLGIAYGAIKTHGFRADLVNFDIPKDE